jgi:hypothetical protein
MPAATLPRVDLWHNKHADPSILVQDVALEAPEKHQDYNNNQNGAQYTDAAMAEAITVTPEAATEASQQENNQDDYKYES